jgi:hypothetical protein
MYTTTTLATAVKVHDLRLIVDIKKIIVLQYSKPMSLPSTDVTHYLTGIVICVEVSSSQWTALFGYNTLQIHLTALRSSSSSRQLDRLICPPITP